MGGRREHVGLWLSWLLVWKEANTRCGMRIRDGEETFEMKWDVYVSRRVCLWLRVDKAPGEGREGENKPDGSEMVSMV